MPATATLTASHRANRLQVVADMAAFLVRHHVDIQAALAFACGMTDDQWHGLGLLTGHYRKGGQPDSDTEAAVLAHLEQMLPVAPADPTDPTIWNGLPS